MEPSTSNITCNTSAQQFNDSYCSKTKSPFQPIRTIEEGVRIIGEILNKNVLCRHDVEDINETYRSIDRFGRSLHLFERSNQQISVVYTSLHALQKIIDKVEQIAFNEKITPGALISLYHMQNYSKLPIHKYFALSLSKFDKTQKNIEELAKLLPCCFSVAHFDEDVKALIPNRTKSVTKILIQKREELLIIEKGEAIDREFNSVQISMVSIDALKASIQSRINQVRSVYGEEYWDERVSFAEKFRIKNFDQKNSAYVDCISAYAYSLVESELTRDCYSMNPLEASAEIAASAWEKLLLITLGVQFLSEIKTHLMAWAGANHTEAEANEMAMAMARAVVWAEARADSYGWGDENDVLALKRALPELMTGAIPSRYWAMAGSHPTRKISAAGGMSSQEVKRMVVAETEAVAMSMVEAEANARATADAKTTVEGIAKITAEALALIETRTTEKAQTMAMEMIQTRAMAMVKTAAMGATTEERARIEARARAMPEAAMEAGARAIAMAKEVIRVRAREAEEREVYERALKKKGIIKGVLEVLANGYPKNPVAPVVTAWAKSEAEIWAKAVDGGYVNVTWAVEKEWAVNWGGLVALAWLRKNSSAKARAEWIKRQEKELSKVVVETWNGYREKKVMEAWNGLEGIWAKKVVEVWERRRTLVRNMTTIDAVVYSQFRSHTFKLSIHRKSDDSHMIEIQGVGEMPELVQSNSELRSNNILLTRALSAAALLKAYENYLK